MKRILAAVLTVMLASAALLAGPAIAGDAALFTNMTTADPHRAKMAIHFTKKQQELKHPVTVFLNDKGVLVGSKSKAAEFGELQAALAAIIKGGGNVVVCPMCMEHYGVKKEDLIEGAQVGKPELTGGLLFKDGTQTLTW